MTVKRIVRCAIYSRKSSEEGLAQDFNSLDAQREACSAYILSQKAEGWTIVRDRYDDGGYSGGTLQRPALQKLLGDIQNGKIDVVVVYKIDRLSRSLMDFAKLVEIFDRHSVTFAAVTQNFSTTTSMGRLTLNVLLSFAQFEREVTGERIRDKFAASKKKGIWMGGNPPLGYDVDNRKLVVNEAEAETVRLIFHKYLELGSAHILCKDLGDRGIVSKYRASSSGGSRGGKPIGRSGLYCILNNRAYLGETVHKGKWYAGEHTAIVPHQLFADVRARLADQRPPAPTSPRRCQEAAYAGLLFDSEGAPMLPTYTVKKRHTLYRYYASQPVLKGNSSKASITRIPATPFERLMDTVLQRLALQASEKNRAANGIRRIQLLSQSIVIEFELEHAVCHWRLQEPDILQRDRAAIVEGRRQSLRPQETLVADSEVLRLTLPIRAQFRGGRSAVWNPARDVPPVPRPNPALIDALARAHQWRKLLVTGEVTSVGALAAKLDKDRGHVGQTLKLAFLSPELTRKILEGEHPPHITLAHLLRSDIPLSWQEQTAMFATPAA